TPTGGGQYGGWRVRANLTRPQRAPGAGCGEPMRCFEILALAVVSIGTSAFAAPPARRAAEAAATAAAEEPGLAAVSSDRLNHHKPASGTTYARSQLTAAHKTL